jgi:catechol 2,3-dioxygenase
MNEPLLPAGTHAGQVYLRVRDLDAALGFYRDVLGFQDVKRDGPAAFLSANGQAPYHFVLTGQPDAAPRLRRAPGLFHVAIRYPSRQALAHALKHVSEVGWPIGGASDHLVSEAIYLSDSEGNGIELYADRPRSKWSTEGGQIAMATERLDIDDLMAQIAGDRQPWTGVDPDTDIGHLHLQVSNLDRSEQFYHGLIGLDVTQRNYPGARFYSAGGYHHHLGNNIWNSRGAAPAPSDAAGLAAWSLHVPDGAAWEKLVDRLRAAGAAVQVVDYPAGEQIVGVQVLDPDGIALELQAPRSAIRPETIANLADMAE